MDASSRPTGTLYVVSTPIGNLEDITFRAVRTLKEVDRIAAEDTRRTKILLAHYGIKTPLTSYHEHNKQRKGGQLVSSLKDGCNLALVSDAGTPGISDPGYHLIKLALESSISVIPIPGVSAVITALSISGLPTDSFIFQGFLPRKKEARRHILKDLKNDRRTVIFYESPQRIGATLSDILEIWGDRRAVVTRELTKVYEEALRGTTEEIINILKNRQIKGEITLLVSGNTDRNERDPLSISQLIQSYQALYDLSMKDLANMISVEEGISRREVYQEILKLKKKNTP